MSSAVDLVIQIGRQRDGSRKISHITEVQGMEGEIITMQDLFKFEQEGLDDDGKAYGKFISTGIRPGFLEQLKSAGCQVDPAIFERQEFPIVNS